MMDSIALCTHIKGMSLTEALAAIQQHGCTYRYVYHNGANLINELTSDYVHTRLNISVERDLIKRARVG